MAAAVQQRVDDDEELEAEILRIVEALAAAAVDEDYARLEAEQLQDR